MYQPHQKQREVHQTDKNRIVLNWGRQAGKTLMAVNYAWIEAVKNQGRYFVILETYNQAEQNIWRQYLHYIPQEIISHVDNTRLVVYLHHLQGDITLPDGTTHYMEHDPAQPPSTIEFKGSDLESAERLRGAKVNGFVFDEYARHNPDKWDEIFQPMMSTTDGWAMFISSPRGFNHFFQLWRHAQDSDDWFTSHATAYDSPYVKKDFLDEVYTDYKKRGKVNAFYQEYMAEFRQMEGLVYPEFDYDVHVIPPDEVPSQGTRIAGLDFGFTNPTAAAFFLIDYDDNWYLYDEVYQTEQTMDVIANVLKERTVTKPVQFFSADPAQAEHIASLAKHGLPIHPVSKTHDSIQKGMDYCREQLRPREQLQGPPQPKFFVVNHCQNFINEIQSYRYRQSKNSELNEYEEPIKKDDHLMDAWRYARLMMKEPPQQETAIPANNLFQGGWY